MGARYLEGQVQMLYEALDALEGRKTSYLLFSRLFLKPLSEEDLRELKKANFVGIARQMEPGSLLQEGFNDMGRSVAHLNSGTRQKLSTDYTMCFDGITAIDDLVASPYASVYLSEEGLLYQEPRNEARRQYLAESIELKPGINLPEDHISFELEFLGVLSGKAQEALDSGDADEAVRLLDVSRDFIDSKMLSWIEMFFSRAERILTTRFYQGLIKATKAYLSLDRESIDDLILTIRECRESNR